MNAIANEIVNAPTPLQHTQNGIDFEARRLGLGGSDIASALGVSPFKTAYELYLEKVEGHEVDLSDNSSVVIGNLLEDPIASQYESLTGQKLFCASNFIHPQYPFIRGNPDRLILESQKILEIKTTNDRSIRSTGKPISDELMEVYTLQVSHYMLVTGWKMAELAVVIIPEETKKQIFCRLANHVLTGKSLELQNLVNELDIYRYTFERDSEIDEIILEGATKFWKEHVEKRIPPDVDYTHPHAKECLKKKYSLISEETIRLPDEFIQVTDAFEETKEHLKKYGKLKDELEARILDGIKNAGIARLSDGRFFTRKLIKRKGYTVPDSEYTTLTLKKGA